MSAGSFSKRCRFTTCKTQKVTSPGHARVTAAWRTVFEDEEFSRDVRSRVSRAGFGKRFVAGGGNPFGSFLCKAFAFADCVLDERGKFFEALQVHDVQDAKSHVAGPCAGHSRLEDCFRG